MADNSITGYQDPAGTIGAVGDLGQLGSGAAYDPASASRASNFSLIPEFSEIVPAIFLALLIGTSIQMMWTKAFESMNMSNALEEKLEHAGRQGANDIELGKIRKTMKKKKKTKNKMKESRSMIGQAKYDILNSLNKG